MTVSVTDLKYGSFLGKWLPLLRARMYMKHRLTYRSIRQEDLDDRFMTRRAENC